MKEVYPNLWIGNGDDEAEVRHNPNWYIISAAKDPWHRQALGYTTPGAPKGHPEYLMLYRPGRMILNLVDAADVAFIQKRLIDTATEVIGIELKAGKKVLVHCNQGQSRSPTIALLYMQRHTPLFRGLSFEEAAAEFRVLYPEYQPSKGMADYAHQHWKSEVAA